MAEGRWAESRRPHAATSRPGAPPLRSRIAAASALLVSAATLAILVVFTARNLLYVLASVAAGALGISAL